MNGPEGSSTALRQLPHVADLRQVRLAGTLPEPIARTLRLPVFRRSVFIHPATVEHVLSGRRADAEFVHRYLRSAIECPHLYGPDPRHPNRFDIVHVPEEEARAVLVAIKYVPADAARSMTHELWVSTAYPLPRNFLARKRWKETLVPRPFVDP